MEKMPESQAKWFRLSSLSVSFCLCLDLILLKFFPVTVFNLWLRFSSAFISLYPCHLTDSVTVSGSQSVVHSLANSVMGTYQYHLLLHIWVLDRPLSIGTDHT